MADRRYTTRQGASPDRRRPSSSPWRGRVEPAAGGARLDAWLRAGLEPAFGELSRADVRRVIVSGSVLVDGRVTRAAGRPVSAGETVEARVDPARLHRAGIGAAGERATGPVVLFEDTWLIAIDKPAGLPTVPTADPRRDSLVRRVERWLHERDRAPARLGVHQRLDVDTSGVVLFTKSREADAALARAFAERTVEKAYLALAWRPRRGDLPARLEGGVDATAQRASAGAGTPGGRAAVTDISVRQRLGRAVLVEARPRTGRKHQIRIHLARAGAPVLGDVRYGGAAAFGGYAVPRVLLHAWRLSLAHPVTGVAMTIESPVPGDFAEAVARLAKVAGE